MLTVDGNGLPLSTQLTSATPHEVNLIESTINKIRLKGGRPRKRIERLIYDKAADSDNLRKRLKERGIDLIVPHKSNRKRPNSKTVESYDVIDDAGRLNEQTLGYKTFDEV